MTLQRTKTILFVSLIAAMVLSFSMIDLAHAAAPEDVENLTLRCTEVIEKLEKLETKDQTQRIEKKIAKLNEELKAITLVLNAHGVYTEEQFKTEKYALMNSQVSSMTVSTSCTICKELLFKAGFDWRMNGNWYGSTPDPVTHVLTATGTAGLSTAVQTPW